MTHALVNKGDMVLHNSVGSSILCHEVSSGEVCLNPIVMVNPTEHPAH